MNKHGRLSQKVILTLMSLVVSAKLVAADRVTPKLDVDPVEDKTPVTWSVSYDGVADIQSKEIKKDIFKTIYVPRQVPDVCTRTVVIGSHRVCEEEPRQDCHTVPGSCWDQRVCEDHEVCENSTEQECTQGREHCYEVPVCRDGVCRNVTRCDPPQRECRNVPSRSCHNEQSCHNQNTCEDDTQQCTTHYETVCRDEDDTREETYACTRTVQEPKRVFDFHLTLKAQLKLEGIAGGESIHDQFVVALDEDDLSISVKSLNDNALYRLTKVVNKTQVGDQKVLQVNLLIKAVTKNQIMQAVQGTISASLLGDKLLLHLGKVALPEFFVPRLNMKLVRRHLGLVDTTAASIDRALQAGEFQLVQEENGSALIVSLLAIGFETKKKDLLKVDFWSQMLLRQSDFLNGKQVLPQSSLALRQRLTTEIKVN